MIVKEKYQHKPNSGNMFKNDEMFHETDPYFRGSVLVGGVEYFVSCWDSVTTNDRPIRNLKFTPISEVKREGINKARSALLDSKQAASGDNSFFDDEIIF